MSTYTIPNVVTRDSRGERVVDLVPLPRDESDDGGFEPGVDPGDPHQRTPLGSSRALIVTVPSVAPLASM